MRGAHRSKETHKITLILKTHKETDRFSAAQEYIQNQRKGQVFYFKLFKNDHTDLLLLMLKEY